MYSTSISLFQRTKNAREIFDFFIRWGNKNNLKKTLICDKKLIEEVIKKMDSKKTLVDEINESEDCLVFDIYWTKEEILSTRWLKIGENRLLLKSIYVLEREMNKKIYTLSSKSWKEEVVEFLY